MRKLPVGTALCFVAKSTKLAVTSGWRAFMPVPTSLVIQLRKPPVSRPPITHSPNPQGKNSRNWLSGLVFSFPSRRVLWICQTSLGRCLMLSFQGNGDHCNFTKSKESTKAVARDISNRKRFKKNPTKNDLKGIFLKVCLADSFGGLWRITSGNRQNLGEPGPIFLGTLENPEN